MNKGWSDLINLLRKATRSVAFDDGLTDLEVAQAEANYGFRFPLDLREFLQTAVPKGFPFPDWRLAEDPGIREQLNLPLRGLLFDVESGFWLPEWGLRPTESDSVRMIVEEHVRQAPRLIPIYSHRMMPDRPQTAGNPIISVHQTDIIHYGFNLDDYFRHEFDLPGRQPWPSQVRPIEFWDVDRWQELRWG